MFRLSNRKNALRKQIERIAQEQGATHVAAALYDYETEMSWSYHGDRWFHAASTIKVAVLVALFDAVEQGRFTMNSRLHVRNRFLSAADGEPYRIAGGRDANSAVHAALGKMLKLHELARHMITTSSNLATNLLLDLIGVDEARKTLERLRLDGLSLRRGVEDERAHEGGINNEVTAHGLIDLFRLIQDEKTFSAAVSHEMREILLQQAFRSGIPAGLPEKVRAEARVAHKTGEISTIAHDAGLVFLPNRKPYALAILTEWPPDGDGRQETVARISRALYDYLLEPDADA